MAHPERRTLQPERSRILGVAKPLRDLDQDAVLQKFQKPVNKIVETAIGTPLFIEIKHQGQLFRVDFATSPAALAAAKKLDDEAFGTHKGVSLDEIEKISKHGHVLVLRGTDELLAQSQVITSPIPGHTAVAEDEVVCYGTAVKQGKEGKGYAHVMYKAQEVVARAQLYKAPEDRESDDLEAQFNKKRMTLTVRPENAQSIRARLRAGFRIVGYDENFYGTPAEGGARFFMEKSLISEPLPFDPIRQSERVNNNTTPILNDATASRILAKKPTEIAIPVLTGDIIDLTAQQLAARALDHGYIGTGILKPEEWGNPDQSLLIFQQSETHPIVEPLTLPLNIPNDYGKLREVILSNSPFSAAVDSTNHNNSVSQANSGNVDSIAIQAEHQALVTALESAGAHIVRTSAFATEKRAGRTGLFTRDPGVVIGDKLIVGKMLRDKRKYESEGMKRVTGAENIVDLSHETDAYIEGGDVIPLTDRLILVGIGQRTNEAGFRKLIETFPDKTFMGVPHSDLHLDVLLTVVGKNKILADTELISDETLAWLDTQGYTIIPADPNEQVPLGTNVIAVDNNKVIAVAENPNTNQRLRDAGVEVIEVSMPNIIKEGGGPRCLTCPTNRE